MKVKSRKITIKFPAIEALKERISKYKNKVLEFFDEKIKKALKPKEQKERKYGDVLTYKVRNGWHIWDYNDTILSLLFFRIKEQVRKKTGEMSYGMAKDYSIINKDLKKIMGLTIKSLAEDIIGCREKTLDVNSKVTEHFVTGAYTGLNHPNQYQINISDELKEKSLDELIEMSKKIINKISKDEIRISQNKSARDIRLKSKIINGDTNVNTTKQRTIDEINETQRKKDLKAAKLTNHKELVNKNPIIIKIGDKTNHPDFGIGEVIGLYTGFSIVDFRYEKNGNPAKGEAKISNEKIEEFIC